MGYTVIKRLDVHGGQVHHDAAAQRRENMTPHCYFIRGRISGGRDVRLLVHVQPAGGPTTQGEYCLLYTSHVNAF